MDEQSKRVNKAIKLLLAYLLKEEAELFPGDSKSRTICQTSTKAEKSTNVEINSHEEPHDSVHNLS